MMFPYPYKLFEAVVVRRNNRCVTDVENSNIDPWVTEVAEQHLVAFPAVLVGPHDEEVVLLFPLRDYHEIVMFL